MLVKIEAIKDIYDLSLIVDCMKTEAFVGWASLTKTMKIGSSAHPTYISHANVQIKG
ncbi:hypothetical protein Cal7507_2112 [Calothrix sp. PCC 7507]|nr:hypothetical protein Cal7507_2112 [Calothrix sp. PCC 7507]